MYKNNSVKRVVLQRE